MNGSEVSDLLDWLDRKIAQEEKAAATRDALAREQRAMTKVQPVRLSKPRVPHPRKTPVVLTTREWRTVLLSGKPRSEISHETGHSLEALSRRAEALNID